MGKNIDKEKLQELLQEYRDFFIPVGVIVFCILLVLFILFPQVFNISTSFGEYQIEQSKVTDIKNNINYVSSVDSNDLDNNLKIVSSAVPSDKNVELIVSDIFSAAASSGTSVGNFDFNLGGTSDIQANPTIEVNLSLAGGASQAVAFTQALYKTLPLSSVTKVSIQKSGTIVHVSFHYKPFNSNIVSDTDAIPTLSSQVSGVLKKLSEMVIPVSQTPVVSIQNSTASGSTSNFPF